MAAPAVVFLAALLAVCSSIQVPGPVDLRASADFDGAAAPANFLAGAGGEADELAAGELGGPAVLGDIDLNGAAMPAEDLPAADAWPQAMQAGAPPLGGRPMTGPSLGGQPWPQAMQAGAPSLGGRPMTGPSLGGQPLPPGASWARTMMQGEAERSANVGKRIEQLKSMLAEHQQLGNKLDERIALLKKAGVPDGPADAPTPTPTLSPEEQYEMSQLEDEHDRVLGIYNNVHKLLGNILYNSAKMEGSVATLFEGSDALTDSLKRYSGMAVAKA